MGRACRRCQAAKKRCGRTEEESKKRKKTEGTESEKKVGKRKEAESGDEEAETMVKRRRTEGETEWRRKIERRLGALEIRMEDGFERIMASLAEVKGMLEEERDSEGGEDGDYVEEVAEMEMA